ncbi:MAG: glycosyltransferase family 1 protein [Bacteroidota bacterium]|nr:glycosyltransferase family 1 protein [Bacteroidota bacterium]
MRIGFDAKRAYQNFTGLGNYSRDLIENLIELYPSNEYRLFAPKENKSPRLNYLSSHKSVTTIFPETPLNKTFKGLWRSINMEKSIIKNEIDVYHGLSNEIPRIKSHNIPYVVTIHDLIFKRYPRNYRNIDRKIYNAKFRYAVKHADLTIAISEQTKNDIVNYYDADPEKIKVIYQTCHKNFRKEYSSELLHHIKKKFNLPDQFILNVGTIETRKNLISIINAMTLMKIKAPLVVVGKKTKYMNFINVQLKKLKFDPSQIIFLHDVSVEDLPGIYQLSSLFVYPSIFEGFGIPILEALCCGIPVITTKGGCFVEAGGKYSMYVEPLNMEELAHKMDECLTYSKKREKMIIKGLLHAKRFEPEILSKELMQAYHGLLQ